MRKIALPQDLSPAEKEQRIIDALKRKWKIQDEKNATNLINKQHAKLTLSRDNAKLLR